MIASRLSRIILVLMVAPAISGGGIRAAAAVKTSTPFTFVVFGDNRPASKNAPPPEVFREIVSEIRTLHPAFVMTTGDLVLGDKNDTAVVNQEYNETLPLVRSMGVPVYFVAGNHEMRGSAADQSLYEKRVSPKLYYSFNYGNSHFVALDSDIVGQEHRITGAQFNWLERDLKSVQGKVKHIFVFAHQPMYPVSLHIGSSLDVYPADRDRLQGLFEKYHVGEFICGHEHLYDYSVHDGVTNIISGGAGAPLYPSPHGGSFHHYLIITVDGGRIFISVVKPGAIIPANAVAKPAPQPK